jgi:hypothetical protein
LILEVDHGDAKLSTNDLLGALRAIYGLDWTVAKEVS